MGTRLICFPMRSVQGSFFTVPGFLKLRAYLTIMFKTRMAMNTPRVFNTLPGSKLVLLNPSMGIRMMARKKP